MSRRDYQLIADTIKALDVSLADRNHCALMFAGKLQTTNSRFDRAKFLKACGAIL